MSPFADYITFMTLNGMGIIQSFIDPFLVFNLAVKLGYMNGMI